MAQKIDKELKARLKVATPDQKKVILYFAGLDGGCLKKGMTLDEYVALTISTAEKMNLKQRAIDKFGVDPDELNIIDPICISGFRFGDNVRGLIEVSEYDKKAKKTYIASNIYEVTWIFFSEKQVYRYNISFHMEDGTKKETAEEFFYRDIVNISTVSDSRDIKEKKVSCTGKITYVNKPVDIESLVLVVPGDKLYSSMRTEDAEAIENSLKGVKALIREKKSNG